MSSFSGVEDFITTAFINEDDTPIDTFTHNPIEVLTTSDGEGWLLDALMIEHIGGEDLYGYWVQDEHDPNAASDDTAWSFQPVEMMENDRTVLQARAPTPPSLITPVFLRNSARRSPQPPLLLFLSGHHHPLRRCRLLQGWAFLLPARTHLPTRSVGLLQARGGVHGHGRRDAFTSAS